jgi:hypothetical protein
MFGKWKCRRRSGRVRSFEVCREWWPSSFPQMEHLISPAAPGTRVVAIRGADASTVHAYGHGVVVGKSLPCAAGGYGPLTAEGGVDSTEILLDDGKTIWECECWFVAEEQFRDQVGERTIVLCPIWR